MTTGTAAALVGAVKLADRAYAQLKHDIADCVLVPGDRFSETEVAARLGISRTPVREALFRLQRDGWLDVNARSGWSVRPLDLDLAVHLDDLRIVLEATAVRRLCERVEEAADALALLRATWLVPVDERVVDGRRLAALDEAFHAALVGAAGNPELARVHRELTERLRIVRRLDVVPPPRVDALYDEHGGILRAIGDGDGADAATLLAAHLHAGDAEAVLARRADAEACD